MSIIYVNLTKILDLLNIFLETQTLNMPPKTLIQVKKQPLTCMSKQTCSTQLMANFSTSYMGNFGLRLGLTEFDVTNIRQYVYSNLSGKRT